MDSNSGLHSKHSSPSSLSCCALCFPYNTTFAGRVHFSGWVKRKRIINMHVCWVNLPSCATDITGFRQHWLFDKRPPITTNLVTLCRYGMRSPLSASKDCSPVSQRNMLKHPCCIREDCLMKDIQNLHIWISSPQNWFLSLMLLLEVTLKTD